MSNNVLNSHRGRRMSELDERASSQQVTDTAARACWRYVITSLIIPHMQSLCALFYQRLDHTPTTPTPPTEPLLMTDSPLKAGWDHSAPGPAHRSLLTDITPPSSREPAAERWFLRQPERATGSEVKDWKDTYPHADFRRIGIRIGMRIGMRIGRL